MNASLKTNIVICGTHYDNQLMEVDFNLDNEGIAEDVVITTQIEDSMYMIGQKSLNGRQLDLLSDAIGEAIADSRQPDDSEPDRHDPQFD